MKISTGLLFTFALFTSVSAFAQVNGTLTGSVVDPTGAAIPNADIDLFLKGGKTAVITAKTTADGLFRLTSIRPETYDLHVTAAGFSKHVAADLVVDPARETSLPAIKLEVGTVASTVEVRTSSETVQTSNVETSTTVSMSQVEKLPVVNRSPLTLIGTQAGVLTTGSDTTTINGQRTSFSNVTLNGVNIQDNFIRTNALDFLPNLLLMGQVSEFSVSTSNMDASQSAASAVTFLSPSGGNLTHGALYWSNRNNVFAANTWFNNQSGVKRPFLNQNQLGGSISGHIKKDKWFYYVNYEAFRLHQTVSTNRTLLTGDARNGIFTYNSTSQGVQKVNLLGLGGVSMNSVVAGIIGNVPGPDKINNFNVGDSSAALLRNTAGYSFLVRDNRIRDNVTGTSDYIISARQAVNVTWSWNKDVDDRTDAINDFALVPKVATDNTTKLFTASYRITPTATLTNELRGGFNYAPAIFSTTETFPSAILTGFSFSNPLNTFRGQGRNTNTFNLNDNASWVKGKHFVKFGFSMQAIRVAPYNDAGITPTYTVGIANRQGLTAAQFPGGISATDLSAANSLLAQYAGYLSTYTQTFNVSSTTSGFVNGATNLRNFTYDNYGFYIQDNFKARRNLTLELGLRYEYFTPLKERDNLELVPDLNKDPLNTLLNKDTTFNFVNGGVYNAQKTNFGPRIGLAWDIRGDGKTAVRVGYGIYYVNDEVVTTIRNNIETNAGLQFASTATGLTTTASNPTPVVVPTYKVPRTLFDNYRLNTATALGLVNPGLKTPYVAQYSVAIQHDFRGTIVEARYVGNHGTKLLRGVDYNQVVIKGNGFLADFQRAQNNGLISQRAGLGFNPAYNANLTGSQPLTVFPLLDSGGRLTNATVLSNIQTGQVGALGEYYQTNGFNGSVNFFTNPYALGANYITNGADSTYNSFQFDVRRRMQRGLTYQFNYTFSKVLSNSLGDTQTNFEPLLDNDNPTIERAPAPFDLKHIFKANGVYDLPFGPGHRINPKYLSRVIGGWSIGSILVWQSGTPFSITSGSRGTVNRGGRSTYNTATFIGSNINDAVGFRMTPTGPYFVAASAIGPDGRGTAADGAAPFSGQAFANPGAGSLGVLQRRSFYGPSAFNQDFSLLKDVKIHERHTVQFRMDATNLQNHATFLVGDMSINSTAFGKVTSTFFGRRLIQLSLNYRF